MAQTLFSSIVDLNVERMYRVSCVRKGHLLMQIRILIFEYAV
jgi:hypothetical protein